MLVPILAVTATVAVVAGCGGDDDDESSEPSKITIDASGTKGDVTLTATAEADAGAAEIELTNNTDIPDLDGQLAFVAEGEEHSDEEVAARARQGREGRAGRGLVPSRVAAPAPPAPGESSHRRRRSCEAGTYYVLPTGADQRAPHEDLRERERQRG